MSARTRARGSSRFRRVRVIPGHGLAGDRYASGIGTFSDRPGKRDVTLIESEVLENYRLETGKELTAVESRRNLLTRGIRLNASRRTRISGRPGANARPAAERTVCTI